MTESLGDRIRARRAAKTAVPADDLKAHIDNQIAEVHARIDKLQNDNKLK